MQLGLMMVDPNAASTYVGTSEQETVGWQVTMPVKETIGWFQC